MLKKIQGQLDGWWEVFDDSVDRVTDICDELSQTQGILAELAIETDLRMQQVENRVKTLESQIGEITVGIQNLKI